MTLDAVTRQPTQLGSDLTIFARRPWTPVLACIFIATATATATRHSGRDHGYDYFLEVSVIHELYASELVQSLPHEGRLAGVIHDAEYDGWPE